MIWKQEFTLKHLNSFSKKSLPSHLGMEFTEKGEDFLIAKMPVDERTRQPYGILHGGASVSLAETIGSIASTFCLEDLNKKMAVGVEINANHLRPAKEGFVYGKVTPVKIGRRMHVWNIEITNEAGKKVCVSRLTMAIVDR